MAAEPTTMPALDDSYARAVPELVMPWTAAEFPDPTAVVVNDELAESLGFDPAFLRTPAGAALLTGQAVPEGAHPVAQAYAGHQFGGYSPRLGDGRALLLGEIVDDEGTRVDLHLKGSGRTPFARGGDGKAVLGPMLREYVISEAMHALGIPTTRSLAVCTTGEQIWRDAQEPGAVLARVAASHLRVGTFQYAAALGEPDVLRRLADVASARHHPAAAEDPAPYLALFDAVVDVQAWLVARWTAVGFIHGVLNTDNTTISGETIDYGPCAFLDAFDPATVFSSIDHGGRYAFGAQPQIIQWNLTRLAEALLPLIDPDQETAVVLAIAILQDYPDRFARAWRPLMAGKLGLDGAGDHPDDPDLFDDWLALLHAHQADHTGATRALSATVRGDVEPARRWFATPDAWDAFTAWSARHLARVAADGRDPLDVAAAMDRVNPAVIPRNHLVEEALAAATAGDLAPFHDLVDAVTHPFADRPAGDRYANPAPADFGPYQTFCGT